MLTHVPFPSTSPFDVRAPALESEEQGDVSDSAELKKLDVPIGGFQRGDGSKALVPTPCKDRLILQEHLVSFVHEAEITSPCTGQVSFGRQMGPADSVKWEFGETAM